MAFIGGPIAYKFLKSRYPGGANVPMSSGNPYKEKGLSKLEILLGPNIFSELEGKVVLDFGCGAGSNCIELAQRGVRKTIGLDLREDVLTQARAAAQQSGLADRCEFVTSYQEKADVVLSNDAFEHFEKPGEILGEMRRLLRDDGYAIVEFGPTWYRPYGGHLFSVFPWAHLIFTEKALIRWRSDFKTDRATRFHEVAGGLNQMTIRRWEHLVEASPFRFQSYELVPIRAAQRFHHPITRELLTSIIRSRLIPR